MTQIYFQYSSSWLITDREIKLSMPEISGITDTVYGSMTLVGFPTGVGKPWWLEDRQIHREERAGKQRLFSEYWEGCKV